MSIARLGVSGFEAYVCLLNLDERSLLRRPPFHRHCSPYAVNPSVEEPSFSRGILLPFLFSAPLAIQHGHQDLDVTLTLCPVFLPLSSSFRWQCRHTMLFHVAGNTWPCFGHRRMWPISKQGVLTITRHPDGKGNSSGKDPMKLHPTTKQKTHRGL
jgi:hypothetical protein